MRRGQFLIDPGRRRSGATRSAMIPARRERFNREFSARAATATSRGRLGRRTGVDIEFRLSETPCFFPASLLNAAGRRRARARSDQLLGNPAYLRAADDDRAAGVSRGHGRDAADVSVQSTSASSRPTTGFEGRLVELQAFRVALRISAGAGRDAPSRRTSSNDLGDVPGRSRRASSTSRRSAARSSAATIPHEVVLMEIDPRAPEDAAGFRGDRAAVGRAGDRHSRRSPRRPPALLPARRQSRRRSRASTTASFPTSSTKPADAAVRATATISTSSGPAGPTGSSASASSRFRGCATRGCRETHFLERHRRACRADRERVAAEAAVLVRRRRHHLRADRRAISRRFPQDERAALRAAGRVAFTPVIDTPDGPTQAEIRIMFVRDGDALSRR